jgi:hypothetical protein
MPSARGQELWKERRPHPQFVPIRLEGRLEVEGSEHLPEEFLRERRVDVQQPQEIDELLRLFQIGLRSQRPFGASSRNTTLASTGPIRTAPSVTLTSSRTCWTATRRRMTPQDRPAGTNAGR